MVLLIVCLIGSCAYFFCPIPLQFLLTGINFFVPDPIPFLDEVIMIGGILAKLFWLDNFYISDYVEDLKEKISFLIKKVVDCCSESF